jgi:hypothetical protein
MATIVDGDGTRVPRDNAESDLKARLGRNGQRVWREVRWTAFVLLVVWIAYKVLEHGGLR